MPSLTSTSSQTYVSSLNPPVSYSDFIVGAAIFDLNGLPKEYYTSAQSNNNMSWVQTIFQALGLRSLLMSSLQLEGFHHATIRGVEYCAIVVKQKNYYTALLLKGQEGIVNDALIQWVQNFQPQELKQDARFRVT